MFRKNYLPRLLIGALLSLGSSAVFAQDLSPGGNHADAAGFGTPLDPSRYVESELDWRSYYLNRLNAPRTAVRPAAGPVSGAGEGR